MINTCTLRVCKVNVNFLFHLGDIFISKECISDDVKTQDLSSRTNRTVCDCTYNGRVRKSNEVGNRWTSEWLDGMHETDKLTMWTDHIHKLYLL